MKRDEAVSTLVKYRLEQAEAAIRDAKCLAEGYGSRQSIINRSYYAMFYAALALLMKSGLSSSKHSGVLAVFDREFVQKGIFPKELSKDFHSVFDVRQECDYKTTKMPSPEETREIQTKAVRFVDAVRIHILGEGCAEEG